jgi:hypothetical protein
MACILVWILLSCNKPETQDNIDVEPLQELIGHLCMFDHNHLSFPGDSVLFFSGEGMFGNIFEVVIEPPNRTRYNAVYYQGDSLNALYNVPDSPSGRKFFFEVIAFNTDEATFNRISEKLDELLVQTGPDNYVDGMLDGSSFYCSYKGKTIKINDGLVMDKFIAYSIYLQDSVIRPFRVLKAKTRREVDSKNR